MTKAEAIEWFKLMREYFENTKYVDALNKAIKALEQDKIIYCEDCEFLRWYEDGEYYYCALENRPNRNWSVDETDFCSWGDRKE